MMGVHRGQKRMSDLLDLELQMTVSMGCKELDFDPLVEQQALLTTEPSLQPMVVNFDCRLTRKSLDY